MAYYHLVTGCLDEATKSVQEAVRSAQELGLPLWDLRAHTALGIVYIHRGELREAVLALSDEYQLACAWGFAPDQAVVLYELGRAHLALGDLEAAGGALQTLLGLADQGDLREYQVRGRWLQGLLAIDRADPDGALEALEDARARAEVIGARLILWRIESALGDVHRAAQRRTEANAAYRRGWEILRAMAATLPDEQVCGSLLESPLAAALRIKVETGD
jgi:tetratricopeptide (TPR) repeat protein